MAKWIEHIKANNETGTLCGKENKTCSNEFDRDVDPEVICSACKKALARKVKDLIINDYGSFWVGIENRILNIDELA